MGLWRWSKSRFLVRSCGSTLHLPSLSPCLWFAGEICFRQGVLALLDLPCVRQDSSLPPISDERLFDAVNIILSYQNRDGGWATYENTRGFRWWDNDVIGDGGDGVVPLYRYTTPYFAKHAHAYISPVAWHRVWFCGGLSTVWRDGVRQGDRRFRTGQDKHSVPAHAILWAAFRGPVLCPVYFFPGVMCCASSATEGCIVCVCVYLFCAMSEVCCVWRIVIPPDPRLSRGYDWNFCKAEIW